MILTYIFNDEIKKMDITPEMISFGSYRIPVANLSSVYCPRNLAVWKAIDAIAIPLNIIAILSVIGLSFYAKRFLGSMEAAAAVFALLFSIYIALVFFVFWLFKVRAKRDLVLLTHGGPMTVFKRIRRKFAFAIIRILQDVMLGEETRRIHVDARRRSITFFDPVWPEA